MSLNKAIMHGKEHREPYRGAKAIDPTCRNHGDDPWARDNRLYKYDREYEGDMEYLKAMLKEIDQLKEVVKSV